MRGRSYQGHVPFGLFPRDEMKQAMLLQADENWEGDGGWF